MAQWLLSQRKLSVGRMGKSLGLNQRVSPRTWIEGRQRSDRANEPLGGQEADLGLMEGLHPSAQGRPQSVPYAPTPAVDKRMTELRRPIKKRLPEHVKEPLCLRSFRISPRAWTSWSNGS